AGRPGTQHPEEHAAANGLALDPNRLDRIHSVHHIQFYGTAARFGRRAGQLILSSERNTRARPCPSTVLASSSKASDASLLGSAATTGLPSSPPSRSSG